MVEEIREVLLAIEQSLSEADNTPDNQCNDMTLNHLKIANEWQKRRIKQPPEPPEEIISKEDDCWYGGNKRNTVRSRKDE